MGIEAAEGDALALQPGLPIEPLDPRYADLLSWNACLIVEQCADGVSAAFCRHELVLEGLLGRSRSDDEEEEQRRVVAQ